MNLRANKTTKILILVGILCFIFISLVRAVARPQPPAQIIGVFWQPDLKTKPQGNWDLIGARTFIPQFGINNGKSWFPTTSHIEEWETIPNWKEVQQEPWAKNMILGLSGNYNETKARANVYEHGKISLKFIKEVQLSSPPQAYYFPVEADPSWLRVSILAKTLKTLPKPLWISIYSNEENPPNYVAWLESWLPNDTNVFFQDGVGTGVRSPEQALNVLKKLQQKFGKERIVIVLEAFRHNKDGSFRPAHSWEIIQQLKTYEGQKVYIFDGPHYVDKTTVYAISLWQKLAY